jgi:hypothetical protein
MKRTFLAITIALLCGTAMGANTDPFDFDYQINAGNPQRPALMFNDGSNTYIQPRPGQLITAADSHREGPYVVIAGVPETVEYTVNGGTVTANWKRGNSFMGEAGNATGDLPPTFAGFSDRLILVGPHGAIGSVRTLSTDMPLSLLVKALVPQGWTGSAMKTIDLTKSAAFSTREGENWMQALDRLMTQSGLYAQVDFANEHISLRDNAPKSAGVNYAADARVGEGERATLVKRVDVEIPSSVATPPSGPTLASAFGADAIRDSGDGHIQLRFASKPADLSVTTTEGKSLHPKWDDHSHVMTFERADRFVVSDGKTQVEVARVRNIDFQFDRDNAAGLETVFEKDGATFLKFAESVIRVSVFDADHIGHGEHKGRYFKFDGTPEKLTVVADGNVLEVARAPVVRFYQRSGVAS